MRPLSRTAAAVAVAALAGTLLASPASARPAIVLAPGSVERGPDISVPHLDVDGHTIVDGAIRVTVAGPQVRLLGKSGAAYVVGTTSKQGGHGRIYRIAADGTRTLIAKAHPYMSVLSGDGATLVTSVLGRTSQSVITAYDVATATQKAQRVFRDYAVALDAQADQVILGNTKRTQLWTTTSDRVSTVSQDPGYIADLAAGVVGTFTKDPYDGGCTELREVVSGDLVWRSCTEAVAAFSTDGSRIATVGIMSDGPGPGRVDARTITGKHLGRYQVRSGWFDDISFESPTALLLEVHGIHKAFTARCTGQLCERADDLHPAAPLRIAG